MSDHEQKAADYRHYRGIDRPWKPKKPKRIPFGKHRGSLIADVPAEYLLWLLSLANLSDPLRAAVKADLVRRQEAAQALLPLADATG